MELGGGGYLTTKLSWRLHIKQINQQSQKQTDLSENSLGVRTQKRYYIDLSFQSDPNWSTFKRYSFPLQTHS